MHKTVQKSYCLLTKLFTSKTFKMRFNYLFLALIFYDMFAFSFSYPKEDAKSVRDLVVDEGFPFETHHVESEDGYILEMHRIPGSRRNNGTEREKYPVLVKHGLGESSALFLLAGAEKSLGFILAEVGYDVWLGNSRGSKYSRNHTIWDESSFGFWNFSWHEIGLYDDSAMMDYILKFTKQKKLFYICHSEGCTELYVLLSLRPEYNDKMHIAVNLAPAAFMGNLSGIARIGADYIYLLSFIFDTFGHVNMLDGSTWLRIVTNIFCAKGTITQPICILIIFLVAGFSPSEQDTKVFEKFLQYFPSGGSSKQIIHYGMETFYPREFRYYDYGSWTNKKVYHSKTPPKYPLEKATVPMVVFVSYNDYLASAMDAEMLVKILTNVVGHELVKGFNHFDFLIGIDVRNKVYLLALQFMETYRNKF